MRDYSQMALVVTDNDRPTPKVWQPWAWFLEAADDMRKELPTRSHREHRMRERLSLGNALRRSPSPEINVVDSSPVEGYLPPGYYVPSDPTFDDDLPLDMSTKRRSPTPPPASSATMPHRTNFPLSPPPAHSAGHASTPPPLCILPGTPPLQLPPPAHTPSSTCHSSSPPPYTTTTSCHPSQLPFPPGGLRGRPSVITCVSPRYVPNPQALKPCELPQAHQQPPPTLIAASKSLGAPPPPSYEDRVAPPPSYGVSAPPPSYSVATAHLREQKMVVLSAGSPVSELSVSCVPTGRPSTTFAPSSPPASKTGSSALPALIRARSPPRHLEEQSTNPKRKVVQASPADPDIDEHFRRSLGHNYQQLFLNSSDAEDTHDSNDSVDDHFAKALGDTWVKIKAGSTSRDAPRAGSVPREPLPSSVTSLLTTPASGSSSPTFANLGGMGSSPPPLIHKKLLSGSAAPTSYQHRLVHSRSHSPPSTSLKILSASIDSRYRSSPDVSITRISPSTSGSDYQPLE